MIIAKTTVVILDINKAFLRESKIPWFGFNVFTSVFSTKLLLNNLAIRVTIPKRNHS